MLRFIGRLILIPLGIVMAALTAGVFLVSTGFIQPSLGGALTEAAISTVRRLMESLMEDGEAAVRFARLAQGVSTLSVAVLFLPVALVAAVAEVFSMRHWLLQALLAGVLTALLPWAMLPDLIGSTPLASSLTGLLAATGALAGSIYWMVAGHGAGSDPKTIEERATVKAPAQRR
jgi:hypothetical protein